MRDILYKGDKQYMHVFSPLGSVGRLLVDCKIKNVSNVSVTKATSKVVCAWASTRGLSRYAIPNEGEQSERLFGMRLTVFTAASNIQLTAKPPWNRLSYISRKFWVH